MTGGKVIWKIFLCCRAHWEAGSGNTTIPHPITASKSMVVLLSILHAPLSGRCNIILSVTGMQENHKQAKSKSTMPLTTQYNIPTEVAIVYPIIKKVHSMRKCSHRFNYKKLSMEKISVRNSSWFTQHSQVVFAGRCKHLVWWYFLHLLLVCSFKDSQEGTQCSGRVS